MKTHNKFLLFNLLFILSFLLFFFLSSKNVWADTDNIRAFVFTTTEQAVKPGEISKSITVQTQNSSGASEPVSETNDVTFTSTSPTGEFLNSSSNAVSTTMSKNTSSRTFYYRDSTLGDFDLTVSIKGRETGKTFSATAKITISSNAESDTTTTSGGSSDTGSTSSGSGSGTSSHSSQVSVSTVAESFDLKVSAGRKRLAVSGAEVDFEASTIIEGNLSGSVYYDWTFGDGTSGVGKEIKHIYRFPGEYNIVLNAKAGDKEAVSRTEIKVVPADVVIKEIGRGKGGFVEIANNSSYETNLGNFVLAYASSTHVLPKDTIIKPKTSIKIPIAIAEEASLVLKYPEGEMLASHESSLVNSLEKEKIISELENKLAFLEKEAIKIRLAENNSPKELETVSKSENLSNEVTPQNTLAKDVTASNSNEIPKGETEQSASLLNAFENHEENQGWVSKSFRFFKGIFGY